MMTMVSSFFEGFDSIPPNDCQVSIGQSENGIIVGERIELHEIIILNKNEGRATEQSWGGH